jgi:hypothetical protein
LPTELVTILFGGYFYFTYLCYSRIISINNVSNEDKSTDVIQEYLNDNGMGDEEYEFKQL